MTLRHRLLLVFMVVVVLSIATVTVALFELEHTRRIYGVLQPWNDMALTAQKLQSAYSGGGPATEDQQAAFVAMLVTQYPKLSAAAEYRSVDQVREALNRLNRRFQEWAALPPDQQVGQAEKVRQALRNYAELVEDELVILKTEAANQEKRKTIILVVLAALTATHIALVGWLLQRWLIRPMEQVNRQVEALARDESAPEPLVTTPYEIANLAGALDRAHRSLRSLRQQLLEAERLTTIGHLAAQLAHNLRNPLASVRATAQLTARRAADDPDTARRMQDVLASVDRMNRWIVSLMELAKSQPTPVQAADLRPTLDRVSNALRNELASKDLEITMEVPDKPLTCLHDPDTLEHALVAMVVNAIEASPLGGRITLRAEHLPASPSLTASREPVSPATPPSAGAGEQADSASPSAGARCRISVIDQGQGLPADAPERIFEFSFSTKQRGMGLGLAIARQALLRQGGIARAWNNSAGGATVAVELPMPS